MCVLMQLDGIYGVDLLHVSDSKVDLQWFIS